jgi:hypothetical protein
MGNLASLNFPSISRFWNSPSKPVPPTPQFAETRQIAEWLQRYNNAFRRFPIVMRRGLYPVIQEEVKAITPLLNEGRWMVQAGGRVSQATQLIHNLVLPRLQYLQTTCQSATQTLAKHSNETNEESKWIKKWNQFGLPPYILENHADFVRFLFNSEIIYSIVGFRETCGNNNEHGIRIDQDGHPLLKMQGNWVRWERISQELCYDTQSKQIRSRTRNTAQGWGYFHPQGLVPLDRFNYDRAFPIYQLTQEEYQRTLQHARRFYETHLEKDPGIPKDCIVQFFTSPRRQFPRTFLLDNVNSQYPSHVGVRVIQRNPNGGADVYSFGLQTDLSDSELLHSDYLNYLLITARGKITMLDFEEFWKPYAERIVTSIPLSSQDCQGVLDFVNEMNRKQIRFQYARQNCCVLMLEILKRAGYEIDIRTNLVDYFYDALPNFNQIPKIGPLIAKVEQCVQRIWRALPQWITSPPESIKKAILYVPRKTLDFIAILVSLKLGANKKTVPLPAGVQEDEFSNKPKFQNFSSVIRSPWDVFSNTEQITAIYSAKKFMDWQLAQASTARYPYSGRPKLCIVPPAA